MGISGEVGWTESKVLMGVRDPPSLIHCYACWEL